MELELTFRNQTTGKVEKGNVEWQDTLNNILHELKTAQLITTLTPTFKKNDGSILSQTETFQNLGIIDNDTILIEEATSTKVQPEQHEQPEPPGKIWKDMGEGNPPPRSKRTSAQKFHQLGIFVLDGSYSMNAPAQGGILKKDAVNKAIRDTISNFKTSRKANNFSFSVLCFGHNATEKLNITKATQIDTNIDFDPTIDHNEGTCIYEGLEKAETIAQTFLRTVEDEDLPHSIVVVVLSDGECSDPTRTIEAANRLKEISQVKICSTFLSDPNNHIPEAEYLMKHVCTNESIDFTNTYDADSLREFFKRSISKVL